MFILWVVLFVSPSEICLTGISTSILRRYICYLEGHIGAVYITKRETLHASSCVNSIFLTKEFLSIFFFCKGDNGVVVF